MEIVQFRLANNKPHYYFNNASRVIIHSFFLSPIKTPIAIPNAIPLPIPIDNQSAMSCSNTPIVIPAIAPKARPIESPIAILLFFLLSIFLLIQLQV